jgi:hypothetical protein
MSMYVFVGLPSDTLIDGRTLIVDAGSVAEAREKALRWSRRAYSSFLFASAEDMILKSRPRKVSARGAVFFDEDE